MVRVKSKNKITTCECLQIINSKHVKCQSKISQKMMKSNFDEIWRRIQAETNLKKMIDLGEVVGASQPNVSNKKKSGKFPLEWIYIIAKKYGLNIEWILEGTGPQRPGKGNDDPEIIKQIRIWIQEQEKKEPGALAWFTYDFRKKYPEFDRWEKREKGDSVESDTGIKKNTA